MPWRFLPPPLPGEQGLARLLDDVRKSWPTRKIDEARIRFAYNLAPSEIFIGTDDFDGYLAFIFAKSAKVLLECPWEGNAAYVFRQNWMTLSKLSKTELLQFHSAEVDRVIHQDESRWQAKLRSMIQS